MIPGIILAAGESRRMRRPKALLRLAPEGTTFVAALIRSLTDGGVDDVLVVGRPGDAALREEVERAGARFVENLHHDLGQLSSLLAGLNIADRPGVTGVLVTPVDAPRIAVGSIAALIHAFRESGAPVVRPVHQGRHGHPVIFSRAVFDALRSADFSVGAKAVVRAQGDRVLNVEVADSAVLEDIDTPDDYGKM